MTLSVLNKMYSLAKGLTLMLPNSYTGIYIRAILIVRHRIAPLLPLLPGAIYGRLPCHRNQRELRLSEHRAGDAS